MGTEYKASFTPLDIWSHRVLHRNPRDRERTSLKLGERPATSKIHVDMFSLPSPHPSSHLVCPFIAVEIFPIVARSLLVVVALMVVVVVVSTITPRVQRGDDDNDDDDDER